MDLAQPCRDGHPNQKSSLLFWVLTPKASPTRGTPGDLVELIATW